MKRHILTTYRRALDASDRFESLPRHLKGYVIRAVMIIATCITLIGLFGVDLVVAAQSSELQPSTVYEAQQYGKQQLTDQQLAELKQKVADIEVDRQRKRDEALAWRKDYAQSLQDLRDREERIEYIAMGAGMLLSGLQTMNLLKKFGVSEAAEKEKE